MTDRVLVVTVSVLVATIPMLVISITVMISAVAMVMIAFVMRAALSAFAVTGVSLGNECGEQKKRAEGSRRCCGSSATPTA